jgi:Flp pilus assembly protein TadG
MRLHTSAFLNTLGTFCAQLSRLLGNRSGNFGLTFALVSVPMLLGVGVSIDYVRAYNVRVKMQQDLDAALIASIKEVDSLSEDQIKDKVTKWFAAQADTVEASSYVLSTNTITISKTNRTIKAVATGIVPTTFLGLANIKSVPVSVTTSVAGPATSYLEVYIVLDKSASMLLAATTAGQTQMKTYAASSCVFACHVSEGTSKYNGKTYSTNYDLAKAMGVQLRADGAVTAAQEVLDMVSAADPTQSRIKVGLYSIGTNAAERFAPNSSMSAVKTALLKDSNYLTAATSETTSYFDASLPTLTKIVGAAGDGSSAQSPLKLVLILTDGTQSNRDWVLNGVTWNKNGTMKTTGTDWYKVAPLNPAWCSGMKTASVTVGVLYTEYLAIPTDWGYANTVGSTMKLANWKSTWGGVMQSGVSTSTARRDYLPYALEACASSKDMFISASDPDAIEQGLSSLFQQYLGSVRLTQ